MLQFVHMLAEITSSPLVVALPKFGTSVLITFCILLVLKLLVFAKLHQLVKKTSTPN